MCIVCIYIYLILREIRQMKITDTEKARIVAKYIQTESITNTRRWIQKSMRRRPPTRNSILNWHRQFLTTKNLSHSGGHDRPRIRDEEIGSVQSFFENNPRLSIKKLNHFSACQDQQYSEFYGSACSCTCISCKISTD